MKEQGQKMGIGNSSKVDDTKGFVFVILGHSKWTIFRMLS